MNTNPSFANPIDEHRRIGTVTMATAQTVAINLPNAGASAPLPHHGVPMPRGEVGEFVCFSCSTNVVLGRITKIELPQRDRLTVEPRIGGKQSVDPIGEVTLLTDVDVERQSVTGVVNTPPRLGAAAYSVSSAFLQWVMEASARREGESINVVLDIGDVVGATHAPVKVSPERLFGRHCAVLGVTGGGKSWTLSRLVEECAKHKCKVVLIDATGEFFKLDFGVVHCSIGSRKDEPASTAEVCCPYTKLIEQDLFAFFTPSGQSQAPMLRAAIRSLKLAQCSDLPSGLVTNGCIVKANQSKDPFNLACRHNASALESPVSNFDLQRLREQIQNECVYDNGPSWGRIDDRALGYCMSLIIRIDNAITSPAMKPIFQSGSIIPIQDRIDSFINDDEQILRLSLKYLSFERQVRPIVVNAIGRHILQKAREGAFMEKAIVVVLDEAHQFLGCTVGDEGMAYSLDAFDLIAKEGRKYGLTVCLATQRPRDIHGDVLSQVGTMIVHRLTHGADREVIERAARDIEKSVATFLPTLGPGHALLLGVDFPVPIPIRIRIPTRRPESRGPDYQRHWGMQSNPRPPVDKS